MSPVEWEDLLELAERLAKERSFLANEQKQLQQLNEKVYYMSLLLAHFLIIISFLSYGEPFQNWLSGLGFRHN